MISTSLDVQSGKIKRNEMSRSEEVFSEIRIQKLIRKANLEIGFKLLSLKLDEWLNQSCKYLSGTGEKAS